MSDRAPAGEPQPTLSDGVVVLRPWRDEDIEEAVAGHDEEMARSVGWPDEGPSYDRHRKAVEDWRAAYADGRRVVSFVVEHDGHLAGSVEVRDEGNRTGALSWTLYAGHRGQGYATRAVRLLIDYAIGTLGMERVEGQVERVITRSLRVASGAGLHRVGV